MPIEIPPTTSTVTVTKPLTCNALYIDRLSIDGSAREAGNPSASATITPYAVGTPNVYAGESWQLTTANLYALAGRIPSVAVALAAVEAAMGDWHAYWVARQADLATAQGALVTATAAQASAQADVDSKLTAREAAFSSRSSVTDPAWVSADTAWQQAMATLSAATAAVATAQANVATAQAAVADAANPPLVVT